LRPCPTIYIHTYIHTYSQTIKKFSYDYIVNDDLEVSEDRTSGSPVENGT
jgi:hypothetical protein